MASKKGVSSTRNGRDSNAQRLGVKRFGGEVVGAGEDVTAVSVGQRVLVAGFGGTEVDFQGRKAKFVQDADVLAILS